MADNYDPIYVKEKFASLISRLNQMGFSDELISYKIIHNPFFKQFENNNIDEFLQLSIEQIASDIFNNKNFFFNHESELIAEYYWAGLMYFTLLSEYHIPLVRLFTIWPLSLMLDKFNPYHEMPSSSLYEDYLRDEQRIGILKELKRRSGLSTRKLSVLTGISSNTLNMYTDNEKLFNASFNNIDKLSKAFNVDFSIFKKTSDYVVCSLDQLNNQEFKNSLSNKLKEYYGLDESPLIIVEYKTQKELVELGKQYKKFFYYPDLSLVTYTHSLSYETINKNIFNLLIR